jgi:hypothetical protein
MTEIATGGDTPSPTATPDDSQPPNQIEPAYQTPQSDFSATPGEEQYGEQPESHGEPISWTASEFIAHDKTAGWYGRLGIVAAALAGLIYLLTKDLISSAMVLIAAVLFGIAAARKPRQLQYELDDHGIRIGPKYYSLQVFRSFSVVPEGAFTSVVFMPLRRFSPLTTIYFAPDDEPRIVDLLAASLPYEDYQHDPLERLLRQIRF